MLQLTPRTRVRLTEQALSQLTHDEVPRMHGRTGTVIRTEPHVVVVLFPMPNRHKPYIYFHVAPEFLEVVPNASVTVTLRSDTRALPPPAAGAPPKVTGNVQKSAEPVEFVLS